MTAATGRRCASCGRAPPTVDDGVYPLRDYRATEHALETGSLIEAHLDDPTSDPAERRVLAAGGYASLLLVPLYAQGRPIGVMEFHQHAVRRWTVRDITVARMLADHVAQALVRLEPRLRPSIADGRTSSSI